MSQSFIIQGGKSLKGTIDVYGSKNAATPILSASLLSKEPSTITNLPLIEDVLSLINIIESLGAKITWLDTRTIKIDPSNLSLKNLDQKLIKKIRSSVLLIAPLCVRFKKFKLMQPGGCLIGVRPIDAHLEALGELGLETKIADGFYEFKFKLKKNVNEIILKEFSVTATENILMLASTLPQTTVLKIAAIEPHVLDLVSFLNKMGAKIKHLPNHTFEIKGNPNLKGNKHHEIIPDPVEAGSFIIMAAACKCPITIRNVRLDHLDIVIKKLKEFNANFKITLQDKEKNLYSLENIPSVFLKAVSKVQTLPYPGIPTDLQSIFGVLATQANGTTIIQDPLYEGRLKYIDELIKMGANAIIADPHRALIVGPTPLYGEEIHSFDLRAGACLIIASLLAKGQSTISNVYQVDRGYEKIEERLQKLGADIRRVDI